MEFMMNDIKITTNEEVSDEEVAAYIKHVKKQNPQQEIESLDLTFEGDEVSLKYALKPVSFEKIRRITGYLVGTVDRFNNGKKAEEHDRVKHSI